MALTPAERQELIIANQNIHNDLIGTCWKYKYKNGKGYVIYEFESAVTLTWTFYDNDDIKGKTYIYAYSYEHPELKIVWNSENQKSGFDLYEVNSDKILGKSKPIILERLI